MENSDVEKTMHLGPSSGYLHLVNKLKAGKRLHILFSLHMFAIIEKLHT